MSLFDILFKRVPKPRGEDQGIVRMLNGYSPVWHGFGGNIYESELVRAAIGAIANHCSKLIVTTQGAAKPALQRKLSHGPNQMQTWSQFLYRLATILYIHNTAFVVPVFDQYGEISGVYPVLPERCELVSFGEDERLFLRYHFGWGETAAIEFDTCGVMTRYQYRNDLFGESNAALLPTMELINIQTQGIQEGVKSAASYKYIAKLNNFSKAEDLKKERQRFTEENFGKEAKSGGLLLFPNTYTDIKQVESKPFVMDAPTMQIIRDNVFEYFGVNEDILQNKAYGDAWSAFYEGVVEPFAIQLSEVLTRMFFTLREQSEGNLVMATANRLQYLTNSDKLNVSSQMLDRGIMSINEIREIWQLPPVENGDTRIIRGEYWNADEKVSEENDQNS